MKRKILISNIGTGIGGIESSFVSFVNAIDYDMNDVDIVLWRRPGVNFEKLSDKVNIIRMLYPESIRRTLRCSFSLKMVVDLLWLMRYRLYYFLGRPGIALPRSKTKYDVAISYCHVGYSPHYVIDCVDAKHKYIWYHHGNYQADWIGKRVDEKYYKSYDSIFTVSSSAQHMLKKHFPSLVDSIQVFSNIIDVPRIRRMAKEYEPETMSGDEMSFVTVGRLCVEKRIDFAIDVASELVNRGVKFKWYFIGDGYLRRMLEKKITELGLEEVCILLGGMANPFPYMKHSDYVIHTSEVEAQSLVMHEAISLGCTVISRDIPSVRESLDDGSYGFLVSGNARTFAEKIIEIMSQQSLREEKLNNISKHYRADLEESVRQIRSLFNQ